MGSKINWVTCQVSSTHSMVVTKNGLCKFPLWMFPRRQLYATCSYKLINPLNELLHKAFIHAMIMKSMEAKANPITILKIGTLGRE